MLLLLSLISFNADDPSLNHVVSGRVPPRNKAGLFGAYAAGFLNDVFGVTAILWPFVFAALGAAYVSPSYAVRWWRWCGFFLLTICLLVISAAWDFSLGDLFGGGMVGSALHDNAARYLSPTGSALFWFFLLLVGLQLACNISWFNLAARCLERLPIPSGKEKDVAAHALKSTDKKTLRQRLAPFSFRCSLRRMFEPLSALSAKWRDKLGDIRPSPDTLPAVYNDASVPERADESDDIFPPSEDLSSPVPDNEKQPAENAAEETPRLDSIVAALKRKKAEIPLPDLNLLTLPAQTGGKAHENREDKGRALMTCLKDFDVQGELVRITPGPVVTMYEVRPAPGIRVSRISNLNDDLALALKATSVRIQAPIPGSDTVGIEIPNDNREIVNFRELASSEAFRNGCGPLTMILGKNIAGQPYMADLTKMPHLLVAGATGAGKSVCLNAILISLLYRTRPQDMQLLLVDPKRVEMALYTDEPHLVHPVVTEMTEAKNALDWAIHEMDRRYDGMARLRVHNIAGYNQKLAAFGNAVPQSFADLAPLPYLVIVIDELADLLMTAAREVESNIVRLAQLARAAGIHMILATQRPSVNVVTGLIKANFPCRISFQVTSSHDSRTILDQVGAERLLGRGDMLFKPSGGRLLRLHGPFLSDEEVQNVVTYWKNQIAPAYKIDFAEWGAEAAGNDENGGGDAAGDALYPEVRAFVADLGRASISLVQRRFKIGFNRAARLIEQLERDGLIGPADGSKPRNVVR